MVLQADSFKEQAMQLFSWLHKRMADHSRHACTWPRKPSLHFRPELEALEGRQVPSTLMVTNNLDSGAGSLRADIAAANSRDTIVFAPGLNGKTITLTSGSLLVNKDLSIAGPGASQLTVSGGGNWRVFLVSSYDGSRGKSSRIHVSLSGLTISNGKTDGSWGGGVYIDYLANLTISGCTLSGNSAQSGGAIGNFHGTVTISGCTVSGNTAGYSGGAIFNRGTMTVSNSTFSGNSARGPDFGIGNGGAIFNEVGATLTVSTCALSNNIASAEGGAIYNAAYPGGLQVIDCVFSNNSPNDIYP
jgi:hypothetical protein